MNNEKNKHKHHEHTGHGRHEQDKDKINKAETIYEDAQDENKADVPEIIIDEIKNAGNGLDRGEGGNESCVVEDPCCTSELKEIKNQNADLIDKLQRQIAEFDNFRKRSIKERLAAYDDGAGEVILKFLPVLDNFERALQSSNEKDSGLYKGLELILKQFNNVLAELSVEGLPGAGEAFDPNIHHAVAHEENEGRGENEVMEVLQKGYKYKDKVLRPSMVKVVN